MTQDTSWIAWLAALGSALAALALAFWRLEAPGLQPGKGPLTLTWTLRRWLGISPPARRAVWCVPLFVAVVGAAAAGLVALIVHIIGR